MQIFGSDELSAHSSAIQQRVTGPYVSLSPADASKLGVTQGDSVSLNGNAAIATACIRSRIKPGTAALYADESIDFYALPAAIPLKKSEQQKADRGIDGLIISDRYEEYS